MAIFNSKSLITRLLAGPIPFMPADEMDELDMDITIPTHSTPNFPKDIRTPNYPEIKFAPGNTVKGKYLGWTDYPTADKPARIEIPDFGQIMYEVNDRMKHKYAAAREALHDYILGHELHVEVAHQPQSQLHHGMWEAEYLNSIEGTDAYLAGLALHRKRLDEGKGEEKWFSKYTNHFHGLDKKFEQYGAGLDEMVGLVSDVISGKPTYQHQSVERMDYKAGPEGTYEYSKLDYRTAMPEGVAEGV